MPPAVATTLRAMHLHGQIRPDAPLLAAALEVEATHLHDLDLPVLITGVGTINAAIALTTVLSRQRPREVISVGTAGGLSVRAAGTVVIERAFCHDMDTDLLTGLIGHDPAPPIHLSPAYSGPTAVLATGDVFVSDDAARQRLALRADVVDMEGYAVASAAHALDVPVTLVKHVSDSADGDAARSWVETMDLCARSLAAWVRMNIR